MSKGSVEVAVGLGGAGGPSDGVGLATLLLGAALDLGPAFVCEGAPDGDVLGVLDGSLLGAGSVVVLGPAVVLGGAFVSVALLVLAGALVLPGVGDGGTSALIAAPPAAFTDPLDPAPLIFIPPHTPTAAVTTTHNAAARLTRLFVQKRVGFSTGTAAGGGSLSIRCAGVGAPDGAVFAAVVVAPGVAAGSSWARWYASSARSRSDTFRTVAGLPTTGRVLGAARLRASWPPKPGSLRALRVLAARGREAHGRAR